MLESIVHYEHNGSKDNGGYQDQDCRALQLGPGGPCYLLGEFLCGLFKVVDELTHFCLQWAPEKWKRESGTTVKHLPNRNL